MVPNFPALKSSSAWTSSDFGVHHERAVGDHRFTDRPAAKDQHFQCGPPRFLRRLGGHTDPVTRTEHRELALVDRVSERTDRPAAGQHVHQRVEITVPRQIEPSAGLNGAVRQRDRSVRRTGTPEPLGRRHRIELPVDVARDDAHQRSAVLRRQQLHLVAFDGLVFRRRELVLARQVHPQLDTVEHAAALDELGGWRLDVQDARPRGHPLRGAVGDQPAAAVRVLVGEAAVDHVRDGFEAAVRMPVCAPRLTGLVLHLSHLVHVHERVQIGGAHAGEGANDGESLALVAVRPGGDRADRPFGVRRRGRGDPRQCQRVSSDSRHVPVNRTAVRLIPGQVSSTWDRDPQPSKVAVSAGMVSRHV